MNKFLSHLNKGLFEGRINRKQFSLDLLFLFVVYFVSRNILVPILKRIVVSPSFNILFGTFFLIIGLSIFVLTWSICVRRIHDVGKPVWKYIILLIIPITDPFVFLYLLFKKGGAGPNKYGESPKINRKFFKTLLNL